MKKWNDYWILPVFTNKETKQIERRRRIFILGFILVMMLCFVVAVYGSTKSTIDWVGETVRAELVLVTATGKVIISLQDGSVTYTGTIDEAARVFWDAVGIRYRAVGCDE